MCELKTLGHLSKTADNAISKHIIFSSDIINLNKMRIYRFLNFTKMGSLVSLI